MTSLRGLAKRLGCAHSAVHKAVHEGRLTAGVRIDGRGQVVVVDADAAAAQWRTVHVPRLDELARRQRSKQEVVQPPTAVVIIDRHGYDWTAQQLLNSFDAHDLLVRVLIGAGVTGRGAGAFVERISSRFRDEAARHDYNDATVAYAERVLVLRADELLNPEDDA